MYHIDTLVAAWWEVKGAPYILHVKKLRKFLRPKIKDGARKSVRTRKIRNVAIFLAQFKSGVPLPLKQPSGKHNMIKYKQHDRQQ
jgi:hypothetical protein